MATGAVGSEWSTVLGDPTLDAAGTFAALGLTPSAHVGHMRKWMGRVTTGTGDPFEPIPDHNLGFDCWSSFNETNERTQGKRGGVDEVVAVHAVSADVDVKPGGARDFAHAWAIVGRLAEVLGRPAVVVMSGHGLQPHWRLDPADAAHRFAPKSDEQRRAIRTYKRVGQLFAALLGDTAKIDNLVTIDRIWRIPGTVNRKESAAPVPVVGWAVPGARTLTLGALDGLCDQHGIPVEAERVIVEPTTALSTPGDGGTCGYVAIMVSGWETDTPSEGERHNWLFAQATRLESARLLGCISVDHAHAVETLRDRFETLTGGDPQRASELDRTMVDGATRAAGKTPGELHDELGNHQHELPGVEGVDFEPSVAVTAATDYDALFWSTHPNLVVVRDHARLSLTSPWAVLGAVLALVAAAVPPHVVLPPLVGGYGSLNTFVGLVGRSGGGKGAATSAARSVLAGLPAVPTKEAGSGEGLVKAYGYRLRDATDTHTYMLNDTFVADVPEIDALVAVANRSASTISSALRKAWSGESLGYQYADSTKAALIPAMAYRLAAIVGVQPERSAGLLGEHGGGLPQRFVFLPINDPGLTPERMTADLVAVRAAYGDAKPTLDMSNLAAAWPVDPFASADRIRVDPSADDDDAVVVERVFRPLDECEFHKLEVGGAARAVVDADAICRLTMEIAADGDELDGHRTFLRLKTAALLSVIVGQGGNVTDECWRLAGVVLDMSDRTVSDMRAVLGKLARAESAARGAAQGARDIAAADQTAAVERSRRDNAATVTREYLAGGEWLPLRALSKKFNSTARPAFDAALAELVADGDVEERTVGRRKDLRLAPDTDGVE